MFAIDTSPRPRHSSCNVTINIINTENIPPHFKNPPRHITIPEKGLDLGAPILELTVISNAEPGFVFTTLYTGNKISTNKNRDFSLVSNGTTSSLFLERNLDASVVQFFTLQIYTENVHNLRSYTVIVVRVEDVNDNAPIFLSQNTIQLFENTRVGTSVGTIFAYDRDSLPTNNYVYYSAVENPFLSIDPDTGTIYITRQIDREVVDEVHLTIRAINDKVDGNKHVTSCTLLIILIDINDNQPEFEKETFEVTVYEHMKVGEPVQIINFYDADLFNDFHFEILSGNTDDTFYIEGNGSTLNLSLAKPLSCKQQSRYDLLLTISDGVNVADVNIRVIVEKDWVLDIGFFEIIMVVLVCLVLTALVAACHFYLGRRNSPNDTDNNIHAAENRNNTPVSNEPEVAGSIQVDNIEGAGDVENFNFDTSILQSTFSTALSSHISELDTLSSGGTFLQFDLFIA